MNFCTQTLRILLVSILIFSCKQKVDTPVKELPAKSEKTLNKKKTQSARTHINTPQEQLAGFNVPEGFVVELVASEVDGVVNPIDLTFDDAGKATGIKVGDDIATAPLIICDPSYVKQEKLKKTGQIIRAICLMNHPIPNTKDAASI